MAIAFYAVVNRNLSLFNALIAFERVTKIKLEKETMADGKNNKIVDKTVDD
jgi:hypothetical protein